MSCEKPIGFETLVAYWLGETPQEREAALEEHVFGCAHCTKRLEGVTRLDVLQVRGNREPEVRLEDVPFDADTGEVLVVPSAAWLKAMPAFTMQMRLIAVGETGEKQIGNYSFHHSPS